MTAESISQKSDTELSRVSNVAKAHLSPLIPSFVRRNVPRILTLPFCWHPWLTKSTEFPPSDPFKWPGCGSRSHSSGKGRLCSGEMTRLGPVSPFQTKLVISNFDSISRVEKHSDPGPIPEVVTPGLGQNWSELGCPSVQAQCGPVLQVSAVCYHWKERRVFWPSVTG